MRKASRMSTEPTYPPDAAVGDPGELPMPSPGTTGGETLGVVVSAKETKKNSGEPQRGGWGNRTLVAGAAVGVGSAALVAALLYANRARRGDARTEKDPGVARVLDDPED